MRLGITLLSAVLFIPVLLVALLLITLGIGAIRRAAAVAAFRRHYAQEGKDLLIVLTGSPHWHPYIEREWLSRWGTRAVVFDRSKPWSPDQVEARLWSAVKGEEEHTPLAVIVPPHGKVRVIRFFLAFRDYKHGKDAKLRAAERDLEAALGSSG
jgi:hypothetical protein